VFYVLLLLLRRYHRGERERKRERGERHGEGERGE
jgi:hypothetical protein